MIWPPSDPPPEPWPARLRRRVRELGVLGVSGLAIFALIVLWCARDWFGIY